MSAIPSAKNDKLPRTKVSLADLAAWKRERHPITMMTAYDYPGAKLVDAADIDLILVGDSLAMTVLGHPNTVSVTVDEMLHHCKAVARGAQRPLLVGDLPFMAYQISRREALQNAGRFLKEGGMDAVKLEGGRDVAKTVRALTRAGIPVMGHIGLTPQTATKLGGYRVQGRTAEAAVRLYRDAQTLADAGCFALVLEAIPASLAARITADLSIPTIGIGAGVECDGQVLVFHDVLGLFDSFVPKFVKQYASLREPMVAALQQYRQEVQSRQFPMSAQSYGMSKEDYNAFLAEIGDSTGIETETEA